MYNKIVFKNFSDFHNIKATCEILNLLEEEVEELKIGVMHSYSNLEDKTGFLIYKTKNEVVVELCFTS